MKKFFVAAVIAVCAIPVPSASADPCPVFDPGPPHIEDPCPYGPPQEVSDLAAIPDFLVCPIYASLSPGVPGVVDINAEGDISLAGIPFWDCPPYDD